MTKTWMWDDRNIRKNIFYYGKKTMDEIQKYNNNIKYNKKIQITVYCGRKLSKQIWAIATTFRYLRWIKVEIKKENKKTNKQEKGLHVHQPQQ